MSRSRIDIHTDFVDEIEVRIPKRLIKEKLETLLEVILAKEDTEIYSKYIQTGNINELKKRLELREDIVKSEIIRKDGKMILKSVVNKKAYFNEIYVEQGGYIKTAKKESIDTDTCSIAEYVNEVKVSENKTIVAVFYNVERINIRELRVIFELVVYSPGIEEVKRKIFFTRG